MALVKGNRLVEDNWIFLDDEEDIPDAVTDIAVSLERWQSEKTKLHNRHGRLGVVLRSHDDPISLKEDMARLDLIAIDFPAFKDGRGFSTARLLRERYGFDGEMRAVGDVLRDQLVFMHRCGIDAFEVDEKHGLDAWLKASREISVAYQPSTDGRPFAMELRHRRAHAAE